MPMFPRKIVDLVRLCHAPASEVSKFPVVPPPASNIGKLCPIRPGVETQPGRSDLRHEHHQQLLWC